MAKNQPNIFQGEILDGSESCGSLFPHLCPARNQFPHVPQSVQYFWELIGHGNRHQLGRTLYFLYIFDQKNTNFSQRSEQKLKTGKNNEIERQISKTRI
uniref:Uncharacterized protein n=1 Tax=Panagrolaimus sp. JU765 TaxID=591449 RepID=A0AC34QXU5_9BILA